MPSKRRQITLSHSGDATGKSGTANLKAGGSSRRTTRPLLFWRSRGLEGVSAYVGRALRRCKRRFGFRPTAAICLTNGSTTDSRCRAVICSRNEQTAVRPKPTLDLWPESGSNAMVTCRSALEGGEWPLFNVKFRDAVRLDRVASLRMCCYASRYSFDIKCM